MPIRPGQIDAPLGRLDQLLAAVSPSTAMRPVIDRWRSDAAAFRFHLGPRAAGKPVLLAVIGGTGTGKSTLVNRLLGVDASATSFRRTFTAGAVAIARDAGDVPREWLGVEHVTLTSDKLPARGQIAALVVVPRSALGEKYAGSDDLLNQVVLIDTPDLDGDQPQHHAEADRAFRWAQAIIFVVTPEKYQMTELLPYYRLATRYATPALFVMNKCEEQAVVDDYRKQLAGRVPETGACRGMGGSPMSLELGNTGGPPVPRHGTGASSGIGGSSMVLEFENTGEPPVPPVFTIPRDDAAYEPPGGENLAALRTAIAQVSTANSPLFVSPAASESGLANRAADLVGRFEDQILGPLQDERQEADRLIAALRGMETPVPGVDVNPVTQDLERRLQQRSVLYLIGPQRVLERVRQAPSVLVRLPRVAWDYLMRGEVSRGLFSPDGNATREVPDFKVVLSDQFSVLQSRIDDLLRSSPIAQKWIAAEDKGYALARLTTESAGRIAEEELGELKSWLEKRWNATPRDTRVLHSLLKHLPGGQKLSALAESAPYLLVIALIAHHAMFGTDLLVLGGYTVATWLTERLSNEVASRTRATNVRIAERFTRLAHDQIQGMCKWLDQQAIPSRALGQIDSAAAELATAANVPEATT